jgi:hypothetical protein
MSRAITLLPICIMPPWCGQGQLLLCDTQAVSVR